MIGDTLTKENLKAIYEAMGKIKPIDQSDYFKQYYKEVEERLHQIHKESLMKMGRDAEIEIEQLEKERG